MILFYLAKILSMPQALSSLLKQISGYLKNKVSISSNFNGLWHMFRCGAFPYFMLFIYIEL